jgi:hypothetical protein
MVSTDEARLIGHIVDSFFAPPGVVPGTCSTSLFSLFPNEQIWSGESLARPLMWETVARACKPKGPSLHQPGHLLLSDR